MDDRFDRRELLLHLADILEALNQLAKTSRPGASVAQLAQNMETLRDYEFLRALAPTMTVAEFSARVAGAFFSWPKALLEIELNRKALASTVQRELFDGNPDGWNTYVAHIRKKVDWFGKGLPVVNRDASGHAAAAGSAGLAPERNAGEKKGWPWPEPKSGS